MSQLRRNLLTHTSGIDGDIFTDTGRGEEAIATFVDAMASITSLFRPNTTWSYCNSGFIVAGRIVEVLDQRSWAVSVRARIKDPLGLETFFTHPEDVLGSRYQVGHLRPPGETVWRPVPLPDIQRGRGPAGGILSNIDDLLTFGATFLDHGRDGSGGELLSARTIAEMWAPAWNLGPAPAAAASPQWGLGWALDQWSNHRVVGHGGTKLGNKAWFKVFPEDGLAMAVFCNGGVAPTAGDEICAAFAESYAAATPPQATRPLAAERATLDHKWLGTYSDAGTTLTVSESGTGGYEAAIDQSRIRIHQDPSSSGKSADPPAAPLLPTENPQHFLTRPDTLSPFTSVAFTEVDAQQCAYIGMRCLPQRHAAHF